METQVEKNKTLFKVSAKNSKYTLIVDDKYNATALRYGHYWPAYDNIEVSNLSKQLASGLDGARAAMRDARNAIIQEFGPDISDIPDNILKAITTLNSENRNIGE